MGGKKMPKAPLSKEEYLKRYLSQPKGKKQKSDGTVHYITGEMPDSLDAFDEKTKLELNMFKPSAEETAMGVTQVRKRTKGILSEEAISDQALKARKKAELEAKYALWNRGVDSVKERELELEEARYEASKPLARYADDVDLNLQQKEVIHAEDPMGAYFEEKRKRKKEREKKEKKKKHRKHGADGECALLLISGILDGGEGAQETEEEEDDARPRYKGPPEPPPNRYGIWPGYRWDGVDRSNGFERKLVDDITRRRVERELAYKWGTEDM
ncbi:BUD13 protein [Echinococcus granulosus]|uniref:BUD13 homolog n=1 Tax=Echinococcus granulosus TaxID=6210 RepID=W6UPV2_ECHGR|nr:BUD13 protein [Echinococcus granulosus]EUB60317.1 BUD13 protein [Echinococcus granulosus]